MSMNDFINCPTAKNIDEHFEEQLIELSLAPKDANDRQELMLTLNTYLGYPDDLLANNHRNANKLGLLDLTVEERTKLVMNDEEVDPYIKTNVRETRLIKCNSETCRCCGYFVQNEDISACNVDLKNVMNLGNATRVFFKTFSFIALLLTAMILVYSIFAFATNIAVAKQTDYLNPSSGLDYLSISLGSKSRQKIGENSNGQKYYYASSWLGVAMLVIWFFLFIRVKRQISRIQNRLKKRLGVSDFSVVIENMPTGFEGPQLQKQLNAYLKAKKEQDFSASIEIDHIEVVKYNEGKPFYFNEGQFSDDQLVKIHQECDELREKIVSYVIEYRQQGRFSTPKETRYYTYNQFKQYQQLKIEKYRDIVSKLRQRINAKYQATRTVVFVTFLTHQQRDFVLEFNKNSLFYKAKRLVQFWKKSDYFSVTDQNNIVYDDIVIDRPSEPEDINWGNLGLTNMQKFYRLCFTILVTIIMIGISFVIVYALSTVQRDNQNQRFISILISLAISVINLLIIKVIQFMTLIEKVYTMNNYQISIAIKSIIAQSLNSIFVPIMVNYYIKNQNIYGVSGLAEDIFILGVASSFMGPLIKLIQPWNILLALRYKWYHNQQRRLFISQYELNQASQKMQFQIGLEYIYLIHNFIFVCFYVSLQPIVSLFALIAVGMMYWLQKYSLLSRCQRPVPGPDNITSALYQLLFFGPVAYALGNLTWSWFLPDPSFRNALVPNLIAAGLSLILFIFPFDLFVQKESQPESKDYYQKRIYFTSQYDRLNPSTSRQAIQEYRRFLSQKRSQLHGGLNHELQQQLLNGFANLSINNTYKPNYLNNLGTNEEERVIQQILYNQSRNVVNPFDLLNNLIPNDQDLYRSQQLRNKNPMNQLFGKRKGGSDGNVVVGPSMRNMYQQEPSNKELVDPREREMSIEQNFFNDQFKNVYHSNIKLDHVLGLTSKMVPDSHPKSGGDFGPYPSI